MQEEHKTKLKKGREEYLKKESGLVCKINDEIEIWADRHQYILKIDGNDNNNTYFPFIDQVFDELLLIKAKELMLASKTKDIQSVKDSIDEAREWLEDIVKPLFT